MRADGLAAVLGRLLRDARIRSAALVDVDSGMLLDACTSDQARADLEVLGAGHAELVRVTLGVVPGPRDSLGRCEVVVDDGAGLHHVLRVVPEDDGALLALSVVVAGPERVVARVRRRLRRVSAAALTAGPSTARRPAATRWALGLSSFTTPVRTGPADAAPAGLRLPGASADGGALPVVALPSTPRGPGARASATRDLTPHDADPRDPHRDAEWWDADGDGVRRRWVGQLPRRQPGAGGGPGAGPGPGRGPGAGDPRPDGVTEQPDVATLLFVKADPGDGDAGAALGPEWAEVDPAELWGRDGEEAGVPAALRMLPASRLAAASRVLSATRAAREGVPLGAAMAQMMSRARVMSPEPGTAPPDGPGPQVPVARRAVEPAEDVVVRDQEPVPHGPAGRAEDDASTGSDADRRPAPPSALPPGPHRG